MVHHIARSWVRLSQFPAHLLACSLLVLVPFLGFGWVRAELASAATASPELQEEVAVHGEERSAHPSSERKEAQTPVAQGSALCNDPERLWSLFGIAVTAAVGFLAWLSFMWVAAFAIDKFMAVWSRLFPAFYFDMPGCGGHYLHNRASAVVVFVLQAFVSNLIRIKAFS